MESCSSYYHENKENINLVFFVLSISSTSSYFHPTCVYYIFCSIHSSSFILTTPSTLFLPFLFIFSCSYHALILFHTILFHNILSFLKTSLFSFIPIFPFKHTSFPSHTVLLSFICSFHSSFNFYTLPFFHIFFHSFLFILFFFFKCFFSFSYSNFLFHTFSSSS